ncbi:MAG: NAD(+) synthase [Chloroflexi bacterium]|nr:NAD(+) synthase [Chloroflexota bacterium]
MKLALAQINTTVGDLAGNVARILDAAQSVVSEKPDLIVFPEMTVSGYPPRDILYDVTFVEAVQAAMQDLTERSKGLPAMLVGSFAPSGENLLEHPALYNIAYLIKNGEKSIAQIKQLLPVYDVFYEPRWFIPGKETLPPLEIAGHKVGVLICEDMWDEQYPIHPGMDLQRMGAELLVCMSAAPYERGGMENRLYHARRQKLPIAFVDLVGGNDELVFDGGCFMLSAEGELLHQSPLFKEDVSIVNFPDVESKPAILKYPQEEAIFNVLVLGVYDFFYKNGQKRIVVGLSGGVDSATAAVIAATAVGAENVLGVAIPSRYTDPRSTESARELAGRLGIGFEIVELEKMHSITEQVLGPERSAGKGGENIQARLRMIILMSYVNQVNGMLLNTSNKTELTLGYSTLYGDMAGAISPLGDLTKPEVYALARWINEAKDELPLIPQFVMERKPSAELRENQVDPFDYEILSPEIEKLVLASQSNLAMRVAEHKRWQTGVVLKVSAKSFGSGRMMPITRK